MNDELKNDSSLAKGIPESQNLEFKRSWHDDYLKWVCGFANAIGGMIYIGKDDKGKVVGLPDYARLMEELPNKIRNAMGIICDVQLHEERRKKFISIKVNPYSVPVSLRGRFYYRSGSTKMELTGVELNEFLIKKAGKTWDDMIEEGNLVHMLHEVQVLLGYKFLTRPVTFEGFQRVEKDLYPIAAVREMLLNALVHRTYMGATIQMRVYDDRLSIWNEGALPYGLTLEDLKREHSSRPRNPIIANACFLGGYIDTWGRGTLKIINSCKEAGLPVPEIKEMNGGVAVTLFASQKPTLSEGQGDKFGMISERIRNDFGKEMAKAFEIIVKHPEWTAEQIAEESGKTPRTIENYLSKLKKTGIIKRTGPKLGGHWEVAND